MGNALYVGSGEEGGFFRIFFLGKMGGEGRWMGMGLVWGGFDCGEGREGRYGLLRPVLNTIFPKKKGLYHSDGVDRLDSPRSPEDHEPRGQDP